LTSLPEPDFIMRDPRVIEQEIFEHWETLGGEPLSPAQPEAMLLRVLAYRETLVRVGVQEAAKLLLPRFSRFPVLDYLGELIGVPRLLPQKARTTLEFTLPEAHGADLLVPSGTRRKTRDGKVIFATTRDLILPAGDVSGTVPAEAADAGAHGNGYLAGQVNGAVDPLPLEMAAENTTTTEGGSAQESEPRYYQRILLAPDAFSTAGPEEAYRFHALSASGAVSDVAVLSPTPGQIQLAVLGSSGLPGPELLALVLAGVGSDRKRPMSDTVTAVAATEVAWELEVSLVLFADVDDSSVLEVATAAAEKYRQAREASLGRDLVPEQIIQELKVPGVYRPIVISPPLTVLAEHEWAHCTGVTVSIDSHVVEKQGVGDA